MTRPGTEEFHEKVNFGPDEVIVITGGSGFLGQHIIRVLQERADGIKEIRVVDVIPYKKKLEFVQKFPIVYYKADISIEDQLDRPFEGATVVIHTAAIVSVGHFVDRNQMRSVNMMGTSNILFKCRQWNVPNLVITSTVDAIFKRHSEFFDATESCTELPLVESDILMGYYGFTKAQSEAQVMCTRNLKLGNGKPLRSVILRPTVTYGELDPYYVPAAMKVARSCGGHLVQPTIFLDEPVLQATYAGNVAWAHVLSAWKLTEESKGIESRSLPVDGETFYVTDDTKPGIIYEFMKPFLRLKDYKSLVLPVPLFLILFLLRIMNWLIQNIFPISWKKLLNQYPAFPTYEAFLMAHTHATFSRKKLTEMMYYKPIYSEKEAKLNSAKYYKEVPI